MSKKPVNSENDLSYSDLERIREIIDQQIRSKHNMNLIEEIASEIQKNKFYELVTKSTFGLFLLVITNLFTYYFSSANKNEFLTHHHTEIAETPLSSHTQDLGR